jgi:hypothetical protein
MISPGLRGKTRVGVSIVIILAVLLARIYKVFLPCHLRIESHPSLFPSGCSAAIDHSRGACDQVFHDADQRAIVLQARLANFSVLRFGYGVAGKYEVDPGVLPLPAGINQF